MIRDENVSLVHSTLDQTNYALYIYTVMTKSQRSQSHSANIVYAKGSTECTSINPMQRICSLRASVNDL